MQRTGPNLSLLVTEPTLVEGLAATREGEDLLAATREGEDLLAALVGDRWGPISLDASRCGSSATVTEHPDCAVGRPS